MARDLERKKRGEYSEALRREVEDRSKMRQLDQILQAQQQREAQALMEQKG